MNDMRARISLVFAVLLALTAPALAQQPTLPPALVAYACRFQRSANEVEISAVLQGADGRALTDGALILTAQQRGQPDALDVTLNPLAARPPLRLVIVFDLTDTVPLAELTTALTDHLLGNLLPDDQVALITFSETIAPVTPFVKDRDAFVRDYMTGLTVSGGDNRLYDAIGQALDSFPFDIGTRRAVLVITDSGRRQLEQMPTEALITRAQRDNTQIYSIGFFSRDRPDVDELTTLGTQTGGYFWLYGERNNTRASIAQAVGAYLSDFVRTLNSEARITIGAEGLQPDSNSRATVTLTARLDDDTELSDQVTCPVEILRHEIAFITQSGTAPVTGRVDVGVNVQSDLGSDSIRVVFRVNDEVMQTSSAPTYTFDAASLQPGVYTIEAELWDDANNTLARTPTAVRLYVQQALQLTLDGEGTTTGTALTVRGSNQIALPDIEFMALPAGQPEQAQVLGTAPYIDGRAVLMLDDLSASLRAAFPDAVTGGAYQIVASVAGVSAGSPALAQSNPLPVTLPAPALTPTPPPPPVSEPGIEPRIEYGVPLSIMLALLLLNVLLLRAIRRRKVKRIIAYPDQIELEPQLMTLTVLRDGVRHAHALTKKTVTIGRGSGNDINISDDQNVSRQHGVIMWRRGDWYYSNRKDNAVTRIDGRRRRGLGLHRLEGVVELQVADVIMIFHSSAQQDIADFIKTDL